MDKASDNEPESPAPAWGSGYQGDRKSGKRSSKSVEKGYKSPPGLYDSPSYSEGSDDE